MDLELLFQHFLANPKVSTDTRKIVNGSIFFALKGANFNGNEFATQAIKEGCAWAVVDEAEYADHDRVILVDDALKTLQELAARYRSALKIPVIGITGSNGKTTTKELLNAVLSTTYNTYATVGNFNNHIGVPLSVLGIPKDADVAIIEMGANHFGEIGELCKICQPEYGIITNIGKAHLEGFGGLEGVIKAKRQLYEYIREHEGHVFVNSANSLLMDLSEGIERITYGSETDADYHGSLITGSFFLELEWKKAKIQTQLVGGYNFENAMVALAVGQYFGVKPDKIKKALAAYQPSNNRSQLLNLGDYDLVMDAYNANPTSMMASIENFKLVDSPTKWVILGDMLEMGEVSTEEHQRVVDRLQELDFERAILVGGEFGKCQLPESFIAAENVDQLLADFPEKPTGKASFLIKGSRGIRLEKVQSAFSVA